jgi:MGT family glycosyltransferase
MSHIAMVGVPIVSHVMPGIEVVRALVARGHRVTYANDPAVEALVTSTGATFVPYRSTLPVASGDWPGDPIAAAGVFLDDNVQALPQLEAAYGPDPAGLYLYDIGAYAGRALAEAQGRPLLQPSPTFVAWEGYEEEVAAHLWRLPGADTYRARFAAWLETCGATTTDVDAFGDPPERAVALIPRAMQPHAERVNGDVVTFVGPCFGPRADQGGWTRPAEAEKVLLISLGSQYTRQPDFYRRCLAAFGDLPGWHVVLQIGGRTDPAELGRVPSNVEVHPWMPQLATLEQADAFVRHAGMGGSSEGLFTATPMIAVPQGAEQFGNADRLVELGVARRVDTEDATADTLRTLLIELSDSPAVAERSRLLRAEVRAEGGTARAVDIIEGLLN